MSSEFEKDVQNLNAPSVSPLKTAFKYGVILTLCFVALNLAMFIGGLPLDSPVQYIQYIFYVIVIYLGIKEYRDSDLGGYIPYGKAIVCGLLISLIAGVLFSIYFYVFINYINPEFLEMIKTAQEKKMLESGMEQDAVDKSMKMASMWMKPGIMAAFAILGTTITGLVFSLIMGALVRKDRPVF